MLNIWRISWRNITQNKKRFVFTLLSIILGISFITAMLIADRTTKDVFNYYKQMYVANADYWILSDKHTYSENNIQTVIEHKDVTDALLVLDKQAYFELEENHSLNQRSVRITGVSDQSSNLLKLPVIDGKLDNQGLIIPENVANLLEKKVGDTIKFSNMGEAKISAIIEYNQLLASPNDWDRAESNSFRVMAPLDLLQKWTNKQNEVSYLRFQVQGDGEQQFQKIQQQFKGTNLFIQPVVADDLQSNDIGGLYTFFYLIAGLSIFISGFIVFNMIYTSVIERKREFAVMKSLGFTQYFISKLVLIEIVLLSLIGILIGVPLGILLGDLFMKSLLSVFEFDMTYTLNWKIPVLITILSGLIFPILFSLFPIYHAGKTSIILTMKNQNDSSTFSKKLSIRVLIGFSLLTLVFWSHNISFFAILIGMILLSPIVLITISKLSKPFLDIPGKLATENLIQQLNRNSNTVAILATTIAIVLLLGTVISLAPEGYEKDIKNTYGGDLRITSEVPWTEEDMEILLSYDKVEEVQPLSEATPITWKTINGEKRQFSIISINENGPQVFQHKNKSDLFNQIKMHPSIILGERAFKEWGGQIGQNILLNTPNGLQSLKVADVVKTSHYSGYVAFLEEEYFINEFGWSNSFDLLLKQKNEDDYSIRDQLRLDFKDHLSKIQFVEDEIKSTTSAIKGMNDLLLIMLVVIIGLSSIGTANTLLMNILERVHEIGTMRAIGFTKYQVMKMILIEGTLIGVSGIIGGIITSLLLIYTASKSKLLEGLVTFHIPYNYVIVAAISSLILSLYAAWIASRSLNKKNVQLLLKEGR